MKKPNPVDYNLSEKQISRINRLRTKVSFDKFFALLLVWGFWIFFLSGVAGSYFAFFLSAIFLLLLNILRNKKGQLSVTFGIPKPQNYLDFEKALDQYNIYQRKQRWEQEKVKEQERLAKKRKEKAIKQKTYNYWSKLDPYIFEKEIAKLFSNFNYGTMVTKGSDDGGVDILLKKNSKRIAVQCKRQKSPVGPKVVRELYGVIISEGFDYGVVVCTGGFSEKSKSFVNGKNILLVGMERIVEMTKPNEPDFLKKIV